MFDDLYNAKNESIYGKGLKTLTPKEVFQRSTITIVQVKAVNNSENLVTQIRQIIYFLYQATEITKKIYNNIMNSIKLHIYELS